MFTKSRRPVLERVEQPVASTKQVHTGKQKMEQSQSKQKQGSAGSHPEVSPRLLKKENRQTLKIHQIL